VVEEGAWQIHKQQILTAESGKNMHPQWAKPAILEAPATMALAQIDRERH